MSLDVYLAAPDGKTGETRKVIFVREDGQTHEISRHEWDELYPGREPLTVETTEGVYSANITHNLGAMADAAGIYKHLWQPDKIGVTKARQLIEPLAAGLNWMKHEPELFKPHNASNGWGTYEQFVPWIERYLEACRENPDADVRVSR